MRKEDHAETRSPASCTAQEDAAARIAIDSTLSLNYSLAKVAAIFTVLLGHWFAGTVLWVPVSFGLFVFAFSSAYFTARLYGVHVDKSHFWKRKLERLGVRFWLILAFLAVVMELKGRTVLHWHSIVHFMGLSGALNWSGIPNLSALGAGLWFFTLLLIFYAAYPYLARLSQSRLSAAVVATGSTALAVVLHEQVKVGHELWLTALAFILGVVYGLHEVRASPPKIIWVTAAACVALVILNDMQVKQFNTMLILGISVGICIWLSSSRATPCRPLGRLARLDKYLLEVFLIHTYLFMRPTGNTWVDLACSIAVTMLAAVALNWTESRISARLFHTQRSAGARTA